VPVFSLSVFLPDGRPDGLRIVTKSHSTGLAAMVTRAEYLAVKDRAEFQSTGVYVSVGPSEDDPRVREIYIGEGDIVHTRIATHPGTLDFWSDVVVFTKSDGTLNKAHVRYLESELVARARAVKRYRVRNGTNHAPPSPDEATKEDLESFLADMLIIDRLLGIEEFDEPSADPAVPAEVLAFSLGGATGTAQRLTDGFLVRAGARASKTEKTGFVAGYQSLRKTLIEAGVLVARDDTYEFTQDYLFTISSEAGAVLYGGQVSRPQQWKAGSRGQCDKGIVVVAVGVGPAQGASWHVVDVAGEGVEVILAVNQEVGALGEPAVDEAVEVLVDGPLPWGVRIGEVDGDASGVFEVGPRRHLAALDAPMSVKRLRVVGW